MNIFKRFRIRYLLFGSFFLFMLVLFGVIIYVSYQYSVRGIIETTTEYQEKQLSLFNEDLTSKLDTFEDYSVILSRQQVFRSVISSNQRIYNNNVLSLTQDFSNIVYSIPALHSVEIYLNYPPIDNIQYPIRYKELTELHEASWYAPLEEIISSWLGTRTVEMISGEEPVISYGRKINTSRGSLQSVMIVNLDPYVIQGWLRGYNENSNLVLLDHNGKVISSSRPYDMPDGLYEKVMAASQTKEDGKLSFHLRHDEDFVVATSISSLNWTLMEITPFVELVAVSRKMTSSLIAIGVVAIVLAFVGTLFLTRSFTSPILKLVHAMNHYHINQPKPVLPEGYKNEFGQLFKGFQDVTDRTEMLYQSLDEQNKRQREAEIKALQANINPHFLYNTLDQLNWIAIERGDHDMSRMLELLGKMLRIGLSKGDSIITIEKELTYLDYYMRIQKIQLEDRFEFKIDSPKELEHYYIPKLTLQPFVENAVIHGFQDGRKGKVTISVQEEANHLIIKVIDNGIGFNTLTPSKNKLHTGGYGIRNVIERLDVYFGKETSVNVMNREEGGIMVLIRIPKVKEQSGIQHTTA